MTLLSQSIPFFFSYIQHFKKFWVSFLLDLMNSIGAFKSSYFF